MRYFILIISLITICSCSKGQTISSDEFTYEIETVVTGYEIIWGFDFFDDGSMIFGEKKGNLFILRNNEVSQLSGFPEVLDTRQGGLMDIAIHPDYENSGWIYATFSGENPDGSGNFNLVRFKLSDTEITDLQYLFINEGPNQWKGHYGSRIVFQNEYVYFSIGEGGRSSRGGTTEVNNNAQDLNSAWGKIHRIYHDGRIPADNPFYFDSSIPSIYSYGHRNPQGVTINPFTNEIWVTEHGPKGGDEINVIEKGANYGWPIVSYGDNYDGVQIPSEHAPDYKEPLYQWTPSIATSNLDFLDHKRHKSWYGSFLVCGLVSQRLFRMSYNDGVIHEEERIDLGGRVRNVRVHPDGSIYVSVELPGRVVKLVPID